MLNIGNYQLYTIETGRFRLDGGVFFGALAKAIWSNFLASDSENRVELAMRCLLLKGRKKNILVDCGIGTKLSDEEQRIFSVNNQDSCLTSSLAALNMDKNDIHHVILTHLHFDHAGGATMMDERGNIVPTFPNALYHIQRKNLNHAMKPSDRDNTSYFKRDIQAIIDQKRLKPCSGGVELFSGVNLKVFNGHTIGQQIVEISDRHKTLIYCADLIPTTMHLTPHHVTAYDLYPQTSVEEKKKLLDKACRKGWILFFEHDPLTEACTIEKTSHGYQVKERISLD